MKPSQFLEGKHVLITREESQAEQLCAMIAEHGGVPIKVPLLSFQKVDDERLKSVKEKLSNLDFFDWLVFTSKPGVDLFCEMMNDVGFDGIYPKIAAIGKKTKAALQEHGLQPAFIPPEYVAESFLPAFLEVVERCESVLIIKGDLARDYLFHGLKAAGIHTEESIIYSNRMPKDSEQALVDVLINKRIDIFIFTSPSTVNRFMKIVEKHHLFDCLLDKVTVAIGPVTRKRAEELGLTVTLCPEQYTVEDMMKELEHYYS